MSAKIAIIGGGNLGASIAEGLVDSQFVAAENILVTRRNVKALESLRVKGIQVSNDNAQAVAFADIILFAIKPFQMKEVLTELLPLLDNSKHTLLSVAAGVWIKDMQEVVGKEFPIVRIMPNTAISIRESMTAICFENVVDQTQNYITDMFDNLGKSIVIQEKLMDAVTVLGSCGTAYALRFIRANIQGGIEIGISAKDAALIVAQTVKGAAALLLERGSHPEAEIDKVTTPKGCTIVGLNEMEYRGLSPAVMKGISASFEKITQ